MSCKQQVLVTVPFSTSHMRRLREAAGDANTDPITTADLFEAGLTGGANAADRRRAFLTFLGLPQRLTGGSLLQMLNAFLTKRQFLERLREFDA